MIAKLKEYIPTTIGLLFLYSGTHKVLSPGEATYALMAIGFSVSVARLIIWLITATEIYLAVLLITRTDLKHAVSVAAGLMVVFTGFLWYLSTLAHPPSCGCLGLTGIFSSGKQGAVFGILRNCLILGLLKIFYDSRWPHVTDRPPAPSA